jgi:hypothetical protein
VTKPREKREKAEAKREEKKSMEEFLLNRLHRGSGEFFLLWTFVALIGVGYDWGCVKANYYRALRVFIQECEELSHA